MLTYLSGSLVAKGALMAAIDPELGQREFCCTTYGTKMTVAYDRRNPQHRASMHLRDKAPGIYAHKWDLHDQFEAVIKFGTQLNDPNKLSFDELMDEPVELVQWPLEVKQSIWQVDDPAWGLREGSWR
jgi:hypothetical protein